MPFPPQPPRKLLLVAVFAVPAAVFAVAGLGRGSGPAASFRVTVSEAATGRIEVELRLDGVDANKPVLLTGFAASARLNRVDLRASRLDGTELEARATHLDREDPILRVNIEAPGSGSILVRYALEPKQRSAQMKPRDDAVPLNGAFGLLRGRDLFLLPLPLQSVGGLEVTFELPDGWAAHTPWLDSGAQSGRPEHGAEELITSVIGLGHFEEESFEVADTQYRILVEASAGPEAHRSVVPQLQRVASYVADWFPNSLGPRYTVIITPALSGQGEHGLSSWGTGLGGTLWPLTAERLHDYALGLTDAYLVDRPYRLEFQDPREAWVASGLRGLVSVEAVAVARGVSQADVDRFHAHEYATMPGTVRDALDLEVLPVPGGFTDDLEMTVAAYAAPYVLRTLERHLQGEVLSRTGAPSAEERPLRRALHRAARDSRVRSFWEALQPAERERLEPFREKYVSGQSLLPLTSDRDSSEVTSIPPDVAPAARVVRLLLTAQTMGYLENCGCKINQSGGVARRQSLIRDLRRQDPNLLLVDVGSSFSDPDRTPPLDPFVLGEQVLYLRTLREMRYDALVPGYTEFAHGPSHFSRLAQAVDLPWISASTPVIGERSLASTRLVRRGRSTTRIIGAYEPIAPLQLSSELEAALDSVTTRDVLESVKHACASADESELVVVVGELSYRTIRAITRDCPEVDIVVSAPDRMRGELAPIQQGGTISTSRSGYLGDAFVMYADLGEYGVKTLDLELTSSGRLLRATPGQIDLGDSVREDLAIRAMLDAFYTTVSNADLAGAFVEAPFRDDPVRRGGGYVGGNACSACHASEAEQWDNTSHANAYKTLLDVHRHYQPRCVSCHTVGFGAPDGYRMNEPSQHLEDVQCETCHGPGAAHVVSPTKGNIAREVPESVCLSCHTPEHSDAFDYAERIDQVRHRPAEPMAAHEHAH